MKKIVGAALYLLIVFSCNTENHSSQTIRSRYQHLLPLLGAADSMQFGDKAAAILAVIKHTQPDTTLPNRSGIIEAFLYKKFANDSGLQQQFLDLAQLSLREKALSGNRLKLLDTANHHVLAYIRGTGNNRLLVVINMDEDNRALNAELNYPQMDILFCNYEIVAQGPVTSSLALRPYEARILRMP